METTSPARQAPLRFLTPEAKRAEVDAFWSAHPDALFPQRTLEAVTDYSPAYFEVPGGRARGQNSLNWDVDPLSKIGRA